MILVFFNLNIGTMDVLPNIIGVIMIATALNGLHETKDEEAFKKGEIYGWIMVGFEAVNLVFKYTGYSDLEEANSSILFVIYGQISAVIRIVLLYYILKGIFNLGEKNGNLEISSKAKERWHLSFACTVAFSVLTAFSLNFKNGLLDGMIIILGITMFIVNILVMAIVRKAAKTFVEKDTSTSM
ncbi:hypothetical protein [Clostridium culturomicium]|uniref:hypothetical protein n=1 Tax=Clostridium culturomicium TaxID=1499683 RepID=UPI0011DD52FC|nr:hypothetical protein [Clostridium culturomicium]